MWQGIGEVMVALASWPLEQVQGKQTEGISMYSLQPHSFLKALGPHTGSNCGLREERVWPIMAFMNPAYWKKPFKATPYIFLVFL